MVKRTPQEEAYLSELELGIRTRGQMTCKEMDYLCLLELRAHPDRDTLPCDRRYIGHRLRYCNSF